MNCKNAYTFIIWVHSQYSFSQFFFPIKDSSLQIYLSSTSWDKRGEGGCYEQSIKLCIITSKYVNNTDYILCVDQIFIVYYRSVTYLKCNVIYLRRYFWSTIQRIKYRMMERWMFFLKTVKGNIECWVRLLMSQCFI